MRRAVVLILAPCGVAAGCAVQVGEECPLVVTEVMSAGESTPIPQMDKAIDYIELRNDAPYPVNTSGYGIDTPKTPRVEEFLPRGTVLDEGERILLLATTFYFDVDNWGAPGADSGVPDEAYEVAHPILGLDINNDGYMAQIVLRPPWRTDVACQSVTVPDQHAHFSFSWDDELEVWCDTVPTPGWENEPCFCADNDYC